jgi:hypothetical protein
VLGPTMSEKHWHDHQQKPLLLYLGYFLGYSHCSLLAGLIM